MRKVASESIVLLKNEGSILPLNPSAVKKVAILGSNAKARVISGGGSANLKPSYVITPYEGIVNALPKDVEVSYSEGATAYKTLPSLERDLTTFSGEPGWELSWCNMTSNGESLQSQVVHTQVIDETVMFLNDTKIPEGIHPTIWGVRLKGKLRPRPTGVKQFQFGLMVSGRGKLYVDGKLIIDNWTKQRAGRGFFGLGTLEETGIIDLKPGVSHEVVLEFSNVTGPREGDPGGQPTQAGIALGGHDVVDPDEMMESAVQLAKEADVAMVVIGLNSDWETEGHDRTTLDLPQRTNELVQKVVAVNKKTIIITQSVIKF
jgi:beta-glucosidase